MLDSDPLDPAETLGAATYAVSPLCQVRRAVRRASVPGASGRSHPGVRALAPPNRRAAALALLAAAIGFAAAAAADVELYQPRSRTGEELAAIADGLLRPEGGAMADPGTGTVVLRGGRKALDDALAVLRQLDAPLAQYRVETETTTRESLALRELELRARVRLGDFEIATVPAPSADGERVEIRGRVLDSRSRRDFRAELRTLEGRWAEVWTGELFPVRIREFARRGEDGTLVYETTPALIGVQSGFRVRPRGLADGSIEVEIAPVVRAGNPVDGIRETAAAMRLRLAAGEQIAIAAASQARDGRDLEPGRRLAQSSGSDDAVLLLRVTRDAAP